MAGLPVEISVSATRPRVEVPAWLKDKVRRRIADLVLMASAKLRRQVPMPTVSFDLRGATAGWAYCGRHHVQLNPGLLVENVAGFLEDTVPHELAHLLAYQLHGPRIDGHGPEWKALMTGVFGIAASRCHSLDTALAGTAKVLYRYACKCPEQLHELSVRRHHAIQKGAVYLCKRCAAPLRYIGMRDLVAERAAAPTAAQVAFASLLADKAGVALPDAVRRDKGACRRFIEEHRPPVAEGPSPAPAPSGQSPTEKQLAFASRLAARAGVAIPAAQRADRRLLSAWIEAQLKGPAGTGSSKGEGEGSHG